MGAFPSSYAAQVSGAAQLVVSSPYQDGNPSYATTICDSARKFGVKAPAHNWFEDGGLLYDKDGNLIGRATNLEMRQSLTSGPELHGTFEGINATATLTSSQIAEENIVNECGKESSLQSLRGRLVEGSVFDPESLLEELTEISELAQDLIKRRKQERKRAKQAKKAEQKAGHKRAARREQALATLEEGTRRPLSPTRINAAQALLDRL